MIAVVRRPQREYVDFSAVPPSQWSIHDRLENWAKWCRGTEGRAGGAGSPMFALYRATEAKRVERIYGAETEVPVDRLDATCVAKGVATLPDKHRRALQWCYLHPRNPSNMARELGVSLEGMATLIRNARTMLINRGI